MMNTEAIGTIYSRVDSTLNCFDLVWSPDDKRSSRIKIIPLNNADLPQGIFFDFRTHHIVPKFFAGFTQDNLRLKDKNISIKRGRRLSIVSSYYYSDGCNAAQGVINKLPIKNCHIFLLVEKRLSDIGIPVDVYDRDGKAPLAAMTYNVAYEQNTGKLMYCENPCKRFKRIPCALIGLTKKIS